MQYALVVDKDGRPLMPCTPGKARKLLNSRPLWLRLLRFYEGWSRNSHISPPTSKLTGQASAPSRSSRRD